MQIVFLEVDYAFASGVLDVSVAHVPLLRNGPIKNGRAGGDFEDLERYVFLQHREAAAYGVIEEIGTDAAVVEQGVALARRTVARDVLSLALDADQAFKQFALGLFDLLAKGRIVLDSVESSLHLARAEVHDPRPDRLGGVVSMTTIDAQRTPVRRKLLHVEQRYSVGGEHLLYGDKREVREVLVVNGVKLVLRHQPHEMRKLHSDHTVWREHDLHAADEVVQVGHVGEHVVTEQQVCVPVFTQDLARRLYPEELHTGRNALLGRHFGYIGRWLYPEHRNALFDEVLQEITVVACQLHHLLGLVQPETLGDQVDVTLRMRHP